MKNSRKTVGRPGKNTGRTSVIFPARTGGKQVVYGNHGPEQKPYPYDDMVKRGISRVAEAKPLGEKDPPNILETGMVAMWNHGFSCTQRPRPAGHHDDRSRSRSLRHHVLPPDHVRMVRIEFLYAHKRRKSRFRVLTPKPDPYAITIVRPAFENRF